MNLEQLAQAINQQMGISVKQFKNQLKVRFKEDLSKQKIKGRYIGMKTPTPGEVVEFYKGYKDSLPSEYNSYKLRNLQVNIKVSPSHLDSILSKAKEVAKKLNEGHAFEKLAEEHSDDESTKFYGGDLGFITKGTLDPVFERKAFKMEQGQFLDKPIRTHLGYHLIKVLAKKDNEIRVAQILFNVTPTAQDSIDAKSLIDSLQQVASKENFQELAKKYSDDKVSSVSGGDLGWFALNDLDPTYKDVVQKLNSGQMSEVIDIDGDYHFFFLEDYQAERPMTLDDDWAKIQEYTQSFAANDKLQGFLVEWRKQVYVDIRDPRYN